MIERYYNYKQNMAQDRIILQNKYKKSQKRQKLK